MTMPSSKTHCKDKMRCVCVCPSVWIGWEWAWNRAQHIVGTWGMSPIIISHYCILITLISLLVLLLSSPHLILVYYNVAALLQGYEAEIFGRGFMADGRKKKVQEVSVHQRCPERETWAKGVREWTSTWVMLPWEDASRVVGRGWFVSDTQDALVWVTHTNIHTGTYTMYTLRHIYARHTYTGIHVHRLTHTNTKWAVSSTVVKAELKP